MSERLFLIDCGEGTQVRLRKIKAKFSRIDHIFISHLHGDHCFGLPGLISSFQLLGRKKPIHLYAPKGIKEMLETIFKLTSNWREFEVVYHELQGSVPQKIYDDAKVEVFTIPLSHRIYCNGYLFREKPKERSLDMEEISKYEEIEVCDYHNLKKGKDFLLESGEVIKNESLTKPGTPHVSYAFCSDTRFQKNIIPIIQGVDLLYHESTFLNQEKELAKQTGHSTASQAATIAKEAGVKKLVLGHFSNRYPDLGDFLREARAIFPNSFLPNALETIEI